MKHKDFDFLESDTTLDIIYIYIYIYIKVIYIHKKLIWVYIQITKLYYIATLITQNKKYFEKFIEELDFAELSTQAKPLRVLILHED